MTLLPLGESAAAWCTQFGTVSVIAEIPYSPASSPSRWSVRIRPGFTAATRAELELLRGLGEIREKGNQE